MWNAELSKLQQLEIENCFGDLYNVTIKRDDLIDNVVSGNKWRKLKYNIEAAKTKKNELILTFGGAFSNHLVATAKACSVFGLRSIGIVRGEELNADSNQTLQTCAGFGMQLIFVSRDEYQWKEDKSYLEELHLRYPNAFIIPEGGANFYGLMGCQEIWRELPSDFSDVVVAAGTGTTAAGLLSGMPESMQMHVFSALKGDFMQNEILKKINYSFHNQEFTDGCASRISVYDENYFGGYGKYNDELLDFISEVNAKYNLPLDQVYTAKAFFRLKRMLDTKMFPIDARILFIHTGGLQGNTAI